MVSGMFRHDDSHSEASSSSEYVSCNDDLVWDSRLSRDGPAVTEEVPDCDDMEVDGSSSADIDTCMSDGTPHATGRFDVESDADDESESSFVSAQERNRHHGSALGSERDLLADRRSWVWRRCRGATLAVVVPSAPECRSAESRRARLGPLSASKQNAIMGKQLIDTGGRRMHSKGCSRRTVQESTAKMNGDGSAGVWGSPSTPNPPAPTGQGLPIRVGTLARVGTSMRSEAKKRSVAHPDSDTETAAVTRQKRSLPEASFQNLNVKAKRAASRKPTLLWNLSPITKTTSGKKKASTKKAPSTKSSAKSKKASAHEDDDMSDNGSSSQDDFNDDEDDTSDEEVNIIDDEEDEDEDEEDMNQEPSSDDKGGVTSNGFDASLPPLINVEDMMRNTVEKVETIGDNGLKKCAQRLGGRPIRIGTMCSGTESPILTLEMITKALNEQSPGCKIEVEHAFSAEIVPFKQHYIETNFSPPVLFADITELTQKLADGEHVREATTAYGGKAKVPGDLDMLVAGFSCVDFSPLNGSRKALEDRGESGDTFFSMREYAKYYRPSTIILENVSGAPWEHETVAKKAEKPDATEKHKKEKGLDYLMGQVGYSVKFIRMDTKNYYLPQTRVRGYMVCVDRFAYMPEDVDQAGWLNEWEENPLKGVPEDARNEIDKDLKEWYRIVLGLRRPASVPAEMLLLRSDDPALNQFSTTYELPPSKKPTPWATCKIDHHKYRVALGLGLKREYTEWSEGGAFVSEDFWKRNLKGMVERVLDSIDIAHLRNIGRGFDDRFYNRIYELSQNVYRVTDTTKNGIIGCLTPNGIPFLTTRGGRIIGLEALTLQGLGLEELELNMMTQADLQDLAGNAMSATVVGATLAAALSVFYKHFAIEDRVPKIKSTQSTFNLPGESILSEASVNLACALEKLSVAMAKSMATQTRRLCACEGQQAVKNTRFRQCKTCGHTACEQCGVKPLHDYAPITDDMLKRKDPAIFEMQIKRSLPPSISFDLPADKIEEILVKFASQNVADIDTIIWGQFDDLIKPGSALCYAAKLRDTLASEFCLRSIRRDRFWEIIYVSPVGQLLLTISNAEVKWSLFATVSNEGLGTKRSAYYRQNPLAIMIPDGDDITCGSWRLWLPKKNEFKVVIESFGQKVKTFAAQRGLDSMQDEFHFSKVAIRFEQAIDQIAYFGRILEGTFVLHQECGQPFNTLHALDNPGVQPLFLYLEQNYRSGNPEPNTGDHHFVFTEYHHRLEKMEARMVLATMTKSWRQPIIKVGEIEQSRDLKVAGSRVVKDLASVNSIVQNKLVIAHGRFEMAPFLSISSKVSRVATYWQPPPPTLWKKTMQLGSSCKHASSTFAAFALDATLANVIDRTWLRQDWTEISTATEARFVREFGYALIQGSIVRPYTDAESRWIEFSQPEPQKCTTCAPVSPDLLWTRNKQWKAVPCEEPHAATIYEKLLKSRPRGFTAKYKIEGERQVSLKVGINPQALVHRARGRLPLRPCDTGKVETIASWRLVTDDNTLPPLNFRPLGIPDNKGAAIDESDPEITGFLKVLRPEQVRAFRWMLDRDTSEALFAEEEVVEERLPRLGFRLEGRVNQNVKRNGAMLFFDVGFGKTAISLALAQYQLDSDKVTANALRATMPRIEGKIPIKATVIFMPNHLPKQWLSEVEKFLGKGYQRRGKNLVRNHSQIMTIERQSDLKTKTIEQFISADIIIVNWSVLMSESYQLALAQLTGLIERDESGTPRSKQVWYQNAASLVPETVKDLYRNSAQLEKVWQRLTDRYADNRDAAHKINAHMPTKRTKGKDYIPAAERIASSSIPAESVPAEPVPKKPAKRKRSAVPASQTTTKLTGNAAGKKNSRRKSNKPSVLPELKSRDGSQFNLKEANSVEEMKHPIFEMFHFSRMFIDEYPYLPNLGRLILSQISARSRYGLSGTPTVDDFDSVREMGDILDVHVGIKDFSTLKAEEFKQATQLMTRTEKFRTYHEAHSRTWHDHRREHADYFLQFFSRGDAADLTHLDCVVHYCLVQLDATHLGAYYELQQRIASSTFENMRSRRVQSDAEIQIQEAIQGCADAKEALLLRASVFDSDTVQNIIFLRHKEYRGLLEEMRSLLKKATWLSKQPECDKNCKALEDFDQRIQKNVYRHLESRQDIKNLYDLAQNQYDEDDWMEFYFKGNKNPYEDRPELQPYPAGQNDNANTQHLTKVTAQLRQTITKTSGLTEIIVDHERSMQFMRSILSFQRDEVFCSHCRLRISPEEATLLGTCGHIGCMECVPWGCEECPVKCCAVIIKPHSRYASNHFGLHRDMDPPIDGQKVDDIMARIIHIREQSSGTHRVLLFAQFPDLIQQLKDAMHTNQISYLDLTVDKDRSKNLQKFQQQFTQHEVCLLNPIESSAAGANLTVANHIIFAHALHTKGPGGQSQWKATMTQAVGRALRWGQQRKVHVYHYLSVYTVDIDIFEHRTGMVVGYHHDIERATLGQGELYPPAFVDGEGVEFVVQSTLSSAIFHINFPNGRETDEILDTPRIFGRLATFDDDDIARNDGFVADGEKEELEVENAGYDDDSADDDGGDNYANNSDDAGQGYGDDDGQGYELQVISPPPAKRHVPQPQLSQLNRSSYDARIIATDPNAPVPELRPIVPPLPKDVAAQSNNVPRQPLVKSASIPVKQANGAANGGSTATKKRSRAPANNGPITGNKRPRSSGSSSTKKGSQRGAHGEDTEEEEEPDTSDSESSANSSQSGSGDKKPSGPVRKSTREKKQPKVFGDLAAVADLGDDLEDAKAAAWGDDDDSDEFNPQAEKEKALTPSKRAEKRRKTG